MGAPPNASKSNQHSTFVATLDILNDPAWDTDSGASTHVTNDVGNLDEKQNCNGNESLVVGNG